MAFGDFEGNDTRSDVVEKFLRMLIVRNELSLARNLIESLGDSYNHVLFELEVKTGNLKRAVEIYNLLPKDKQQIYLHMVEGIENDAEEVARSLEKILREFQTENYPIVIAEAQKLKRSFPQVVEVVAIELLTAIRKGDKKKIKTLSDILRQLDKSHPVLSQVKSSHGNASAIIPAIIVTIFALVLINLFISVFSLTKSPALELGNVESGIKDIASKMQSYNTQSSAQIAALSDALVTIKASLDYLDQKLSQAMKSATYTDISSSSSQNDAFVENLVKSIEDQMKLISDKISKMEKSIASIDSSKVSSSNLGNVADVNNAANVNVDLTPITKELSNLKAKMDALSSKMQSLVDSSSATNMVDRTEIRDIDEKIMQQTEVILQLRERIDTLTQSIESLKQSAAASQNLSQISAQPTQTTQTMQSLQSPQSVQSTQVPAQPNMDEVAINSRLDALTSTVSTLSKEISNLKETFNNAMSRLNESNSNAQNDPTSNVPTSTTPIDQQFSQQDEDTLNAIKSLESKLTNLEKSLAELKDTNNQNDRNVSSKIDAISTVVSSLTKQIATINDSISKINTQSQTTNSDVSKLSSTVSTLQKNLDTLSKDVSNVSKQLDDLKKSVDTLKNAATTTSTQSAQTSQTSQSTNGTTVDVQKIIKETRDLRELFLIGLRFYSNEQYENAIMIFSYLEVQLDGIEVYFKEDVYYYEIKSYLSLNDVAKASKKYQDYKVKYPTGQYLNELNTYFK
ncbi:MAG TPA: hypothetical protein PL174_00550 [Fervidobacterium sp.]|mgnify:CR=1 FL=1|nr:hypothetical protein [Fervidobacterium sp.]